MTGHITLAGISGEGGQYTPGQDYMQERAFQEKAEKGSRQRGYQRYFYSRRSPAVAPN